jgi:putative membrane protein
MMHWYGGMHDWGGHWLAGVFMVLFWVLVAAGIVALVRSLARSGGGSAAPPESPLDILKRRYARGEIDKAEFEQKKKDILG